MPAFKEIDQNQAAHCCADRKRFAEIGDFESTLDDRLTASVTLAAGTDGIARVLVCIRSLTISAKPLYFSSSVGDTDESDFSDLLRQHHESAQIYAARCETEHEKHIRENFGI